MIAPVPELETTKLRPSMDDRPRRSSSAAARPVGELSTDTIRVGSDAYIFAFGTGVYRSHAAAPSSAKALSEQQNARAAKQIVLCANRFIAAVPAVAQQLATYQPTQ